jgi:NADH-quinone oxidoreductase subunit L
MVIGIIGYYSKDYIIAQALVFKTANPMFSWLFYVAVAGAAMTAFYMFRLWYMTFAGKPRDKHIYDHAHESPRTMVVPLVILAGLSVVAGWDLYLLNTNYGLEPLLKQAIPAGIAEGNASGWLWPHVTVPPEHLYHPQVHEVHFTATIFAFGMALAGFILATAFYGVRSLDPNDARRTFAPFYSLFYHKWWFDELYQFIFVRPVLRISGWVADCDKNGLDWIADNLAWTVTACARLDNWIDRIFVDRLIDLAAGGTYAVGIWLRRIQTGNLRQYIMLMVLGLVALFIAMNLYQDYSILGW